MAEIHQSGDWRAEHWLQFSQSLRTARSREETVRALTDVIAPYGYTTFIYGRIFGAPIDPLTTPVVTNLSSEWMQYYTEQKFYLADFAADHCRTGSGALLWSEADRKIASGEWPPKYAVVRAAAGAFGLGAGATIPLSKQGRYKGGISLIAPKQGSVDAHDRLFEEYSPEIISIAEAFHTSINFSVIAREHYGLSPREVAVLQLASEGLQTKQIAAEFDTSPHTVEKQMKSAREKLGTRTTAEAVTNAALLALVK